jgi:hypothetical protein
VDAGEAVLEEGMAAGNSPFKSARKRVHSYIANEVRCLPLHEVETWQMLQCNN